MLKRFCSKQRKSMWKMSGSTSSHFPGHTNDSLVLFDRENRALFTGDTFYPDSLFAFMEDEWGQSNLSVFLTQDR